MNKETIGFIGLGNLGRELAAHIARNGFPMVVYDITDAAKHAPKGATVAGSVREVAEKSALVFLCLPSIPAIEAVVAEIRTAKAAPGTVVVNTSTAGPTCALAAHAALAEKGIDYADATISATPPRARAAQAVVMFSGERDALARLQPVFATFAKKVHDLGTGIGHGQRMKVLNNCLVHTAHVATCEAIAWGVKGGLDLEALLEVLLETSGRNIATDHFFPDAIVTGTYDTGGTIDICRKDIGIFVDEAKAAGTPHVAAETAYRVMAECQQAHPGEDQAVLFGFTQARGTK
jgi:3-hydroxyisobutyrate dehydrogenase-like beta-hydroxyacid dehydrogenase